MKLSYGILLCSLLVLLWGAWNLHRWRQRRRRFYERERAERQLELEQGWSRLREFFPYLPSITARDSAGLHTAIRQSLSKYPRVGVIAGTDLPAVALPPEERRRHLYIVGKTGSGKSTFLEHQIVRDLEAGHGLSVISPEGEFFRERLLGLIPKGREHDVIYFSPGNPENPLAFNPLELEPGQDPTRAAEDLFTVFKRVLSEDELGPQMRPLLHNAIAALIGQPEATLWDIKRFLEDRSFRVEIVENTEDEYVRDFWLHTYPNYPKGAELPIINRLDRFLRPPAMRKALGHSKSSFSIREVLTHNRILLLDLYGLSEETRFAFGQMLLSKFQLELMRRELANTVASPCFYLYADEFQSFAGVAEGTWRELLSRGRKYGLALTLAHQFPGQLPRGLQGEILGNVNSLVVFALGDRDAQLLRRELLQLTPGKKEKIGPLASSPLLDLKVGEAYVRFAGGRAVKVVTHPPLTITDNARAEELIRSSWARNAPTIPPPSRLGRRHQEPDEPTRFFQ